MISFIWDLQFQHALGVSSRDAQTLYYFITLYWWHMDYVRLLWEAYKVIYKSITTSKKYEKLIMLSHYHYLWKVQIILEMIN